MPSQANKKRAPDKPPIRQRMMISSIPEDWLAVILAFLLILLSAIGLLGPNGIKITF